MSIYARIDGGRVVELFETDEDITTMFHPDMVWVDITDLQVVPREGWEYNGEEFSEPVQQEHDPEQIALAHTSTRNFLLAQASLVIDPLQDAIDLDEATDLEVARLKAWKQYRVGVSRVDITLVDPTWPKQPQ